MSLLPRGELPPARDRPNIVGPLHVHEWALAGHGIMVRSEWSVARDIEEGRLVRVLEQYEQPSADVVALVAPRAGRAARTQAFLKYLRGTLTPVPWRSW